MLTATIRVCEEADVLAAEQSMGSGASGFHLRRYQQQLAGASAYLLAWHAEEVVGHLNLLTRSKYPEVTARLGVAPEMNALGVRRSNWGMGIGSGLVAAAEALATDWQATVVGLAVEPMNTRAVALYERLGYVLVPGVEPVDVWSWTDEVGEHHEERDLCAYMSKSLGK